MTNGLLNHFNNAFFIQKIKYVNGKKKNSLKINFLKKFYIKIVKNFLLKKYFNKIKCPSEFIKKKTFKIGMNSNSEHGKNSPWL